MRAISSLHPTESIPMAPDSTQTMLVASSSGQAMDWQSGNAPDIVRITFVTTAGALMNGHVCLESTKAAAPSSGSSTLASSACVPIVGQGTFQVPRTSTGWSAASLSSGYAITEQWHR